MDTDSEEFSSDEEIDDEGERKMKANDERFSSPKGADH